MTTPRVIEHPLHLEPATADPFIADLAPFHDFPDSQVNPRCTITSTRLSTPSMPTG
jgi:hypothetical protein